MGLTKLIYSSDIDPSVEVGAELITRQGELTKQASTIFGKEYSDLKPDDRHVGIHVVALGDEEHYGANRNADSFDKQACTKYHDTFVKHGHVFRHHRNKDPEGAIGVIKASAYNEPMGRIELFIHADKEKAAPEIARLEKEGEIPFSMAARVPFDVCGLCGAMRKHAGDASECDHVANHLGELMEDGRRVFTRNTEPTFFDISFVGRPADRIAWNLKVASARSFDSVKEAEDAGIVPPDDVACDTESSRRKLGYMRKIAEMQEKYRSWLSKSAAPSTALDGYLYELRRVPLSTLDDEALSRLRRMPEKVAYSVLGSAGVVMDVPTFFKFATGDDYDGVMRRYMPDVERRVPGLIRDLVKSSSASVACSDDSFDAASGSASAPYGLWRLVKVAGCSDMVPDRALEKSGCDPTPRVDTGNFGVQKSGVVEKLAETYATYQMSAVDAVLGTGTRRELDVEAVVASSNALSAMSHHNG